MTATSCAKNQFTDLMLDLGIMVKSNVTVLHSYDYRIVSFFEELIRFQKCATTARKTIFSFSRRPEKMVFPKKSRWNMILLVLSGKMIFLFLENMILHLRRKMKDHLSQKNEQKYDVFFKLSEKMVFSKRAGLGHNLSCIIWEDGIFFPKM